MADLWMVVEYNQASGMPEEAHGPYTDMADAYELAVTHARETALCGRREMYRVARLVFVTDFVEIPDDPDPLDGEVSG